MKSHTPGPWKCFPAREPHEYYLYDENGNFMWDCDMEANARLIAMAPQMLEALQHVVLVSRMYQPGDDRIHTAIIHCNVIARKATGDLTND